MTVHVVLNDASLEPAADSVSDEELLEMLVQTYRALRDAVARFDWGQIQVTFPSAAWLLKLPGGMTFQEARRRLAKRNRDLGSFLNELLSRAHFGIDESNVGLGALASGKCDRTLAFTWSIRGISWSANREGWRKPSLDFVVWAALPHGRKESVPNVFCESLQKNHREALQRAGVTVVPLYENRGHHDPERPALYDPQKSHIPRYAEHLLREAIPETGGTTFWARCGCKFYHRFQGTAQGEWIMVHWNGTTNENATGNRERKFPTRENDIPDDIRRQLLSRPPVDNCGCREKKHR